MEKECTKTGNYVQNYFDGLAKRFFPEATEKDSDYISNTMINICVGILFGIFSGILVSLSSLAGLM